MVGVSQLDKYPACMKCMSKIAPDNEDSEIGTCTKCNTMQCIDSAKVELVAHIMVKVHDGNLPLRVFGRVVEDIAQKYGKEITKHSLLKAKPFSMLHRNGIIQSVVRKVD